MLFKVKSVFCSLSTKSWGNKFVNEFMNRRTSWLCKERLNFAMKDSLIKGFFEKEKKAIVKTGTKPPISCIIDGIQCTSGCTLGKGNIEVLDQQIPEALFISDKKQLTIKLKINMEPTNRAIEEMAIEIYNMAPQDIFEISKNFWFTLTENSMYFYKLKTTIIHQWELCYSIDFLRDSLLERIERGTY